MTQLPPAEKEAPGKRKTQSPWCHLPAIHASTPSTISFNFTRCALGWTFDFWKGKGYLSAAHKNALNRVFYIALPIILTCIILVDACIKRSASNYVLSAWKAVARSPSKFMRGDFAGSTDCEGAASLVTAGAPNENAGLSLESGISRPSFGHTLPLRLRLTDICIRYLDFDASARKHIYTRSPFQCS